MPLDPAPTASHLSSSWQRIAPSSERRPIAFVRGAIAIGAKKWVEDQHGPTGFAELLSLLTKEDRAVWTTGLLLNNAQFPAESFREYCESIVKLWGKGEPRFLRSVGAAIAFADLATYMKIMMKLGTPSFIVSRFPKIWQHYFTAGELTVLERSSTNARVELSGWEVYGLANAYASEGWMAAAIEYSGGKRLKVDHSLGLNRQRLLEFSWQ